jgi:hypothetical protein
MLRTSAEAWVTSKSQLFPELAELLPPDIMLFIQKSTPPSVYGISLVQEGSATIRKGRDEAGRPLTFDCDGGRVREKENSERFCREARVLYHTGVLYNDNIVE